MIIRNFDKETQILFVMYSGIIELNDVLENIRITFTEFELPSDLSVLEDGRNAVYNLTINENEKIRKAMSEYVNNFISIKSAFVQDKPFETAVNLEYEYSMPFPNFQYKVFSKIENAIIWLKK